MRIRTVFNYQVNDADKASQRWLRIEDADTTVLTVLEGHMRALIGMCKPEEVTMPNIDSAIREAYQRDLSRMGIELVSVTSERS